MSATVADLKPKTIENAKRQFVELYAPLIYRYARRHGLQDADAADLSQEVLRAVSGGMQMLSGAGAKPSGFRFPIY